MCVKLFSKNDEKLRGLYEEIKDRLIVFTMLDDVIIKLNNGEEGVANQSKGIVYMPKKIDNYKKSHLEFIMGHEMAHIEFKETPTRTQRRFLLFNKNRLKNILNETMSDIRGARISSISLEDINDYYKMKSNNQSINYIFKLGYFSSEVREKFVEFSKTDEFTKENFKRKFIEEYIKASNGQEVNEQELDRLLEYYFDEFKINV